MNRPQLRPDGLPSRIDRSLMTPAELAITEAMYAVENAGASLALTDAISLLSKARDRVADHEEGIDEGESLQVRQDQAKAALREVIRAWESLSGGRDYPVYRIGEWFVTDINPVRQNQVETALREVIHAWESLSGGRDYPVYRVGEWLEKDMKPAMDNARTVLGLPIPTTRRDDTG